MLRRDFPAIRRHMGQSRTIGAVKSFFSKNRRRLDLDRLADEAAAKLDAAEMANANLQVTLYQPFIMPPTGPAFLEAHCRAACFFTGKR